MVLSILPYKNYVVLFTIYFVKGPKVLVWHVEQIPMTRSEWKFSSIRLRSKTKSWNADSKNRKTLINAKMTNFWKSSQSYPSRKLN